MAAVRIDGRSCFYRLEGEGGKPVLVLSHPVGADHGIWDQVVARFTPHFQVLRYDLRGHGASEVAAGDCSVAMLADDLVALTGALGIPRFSFVGVSLGALAGLALARARPDLLDALVVSNVAARLPLSAEQWDSRIATVRERGMAALAPGMVERMFSTSYRARDTPFMHTVVNSFLSTPVAGYAAALGALRDADLRGDLADVGVRTLVVSAAEDAAIPAADARLLAAGIPGARLEVLPGGHLTPVEAPERFAQAALDFLLA